MNPLPVPLACAGVMTVLGMSPFLRDGLRTGRRTPPEAPIPDNRTAYERALVLMDLSSCASSLVERVARIPNIGEALLTDILDSTATANGSWLTGHTMLSQRDRARMRLVPQKNYLESLGVPARAIVELADDNDICSTLLGVAARERASLLVLRAAPRPKFLSVFLESTTLRILKRCTMQDVLLYPAGPEEPGMDAFAIPPAQDLFSRVLCPVDLSSFGREAATWVAGMHSVSEVILVHVIPPHKTADDWMMRHNAEENLADLKQSIERVGLSVTVRVEEGDPAYEIARVAREQGVSLVLMSRSSLANVVRSNELGATVAHVADRLACPLLVRRPRARLQVHSRELDASEFGIAEELWTRYRHQKADRENDRVFAVYLEGEPVSVAWCKRHPDGLEVDGVFTLEPFRRREYARRAVATLIEACGDEPLYMHATLELVEFYTSMGFIPIPEDELPPTIKARFDFALGDLEGANACPMRRDPPVNESSNPIQAH